MRSLDVSVLMCTFSKTAAGGKWEGGGRAVIQKEGVQRENRQERGRIMEVKIGCASASFTGWK